MVTEKKIDAVQLFLWQLACIDAGIHSENKPSIKTLQFEIDGSKSS